MGTLRTSYESFKELLEASNVKDNAGFDNAGGAGLEDFS